MAREKKPNFLLNIPEIKRDCRFWLIRTNEGLFFEEYIKHGFIAIGWNSITSKTFPLSKESRGLLEKDIKNRYKNQAPGSAINKCEKFCRELKPGDIAVVTGKEQVAFAEIGEYYEENQEIYNERLEREVYEKIRKPDAAEGMLISGEQEDKAEKAGFFLDPRTGQSSFYEMPVSPVRVPKLQSIACPYCKRRKIKVLSLIKNRDNINPYLYKAILLNKHSLSSLNKYADSILSSCYDVYLWNGTLSFALKVGTRKNINASVFSHLIQSFTTLLPTVRDEDISVKTALHSPGDIVFQITDWLSNAGNLLWVFLLLMFLFGGKLKDTEFPSLWNVVKYFIDRHDQHASRLLQEERQRLENERLREEIASLKMDNRKREEIERAAASLSKAVTELEIRPMQGKIIDIGKILSDIKTDQDGPLK